MRQIRSAFKSDRIKLSWADILVLVFGGEVNSTGSPVICLWCMPKEYMGKGNERENNNYRPK